MKRQVTIVAVFVSLVALTESAAQQPQGRRYALLVGVNQYFRDDFCTIVG